MTKRPAVEDARLSQFEDLGSNDFSGVTRREAITTAAAGLVFFANFDLLAQAATETNEGNTQGGSGDRSSSERLQQTASMTDSAPGAEQRELLGKFSEIKSLLGSEFRGRSSSIQTLTKYQRDGTDTPDEPDRGEVDAGDYFSDGFNRKLTSSSESPLGTALRTRSGSVSGTTQLSSEEKQKLSAFLVGAKEKPNEGRAEVFFGTLGATTATLVGAYLTGAAGRALGSPSNANLAGLSAGGFSLAGKMFDTPGRETGEAFGRWLDPKIERFKEDTGYDSRTDPRYNPFGWPYD